MRPIIVSKRKEKRLIKEYLSNTPIKEIYKKCEVTEAILYKVLKKNNVKLIGGQRYKYKVNEKYFDNIDHQNKAYWLGFLSADGCNYIDEAKKRYHVFLGVKKSDIDVIKKFKSCIDFEGPIQIQKEKRIKEDGSKFGEDIARLYINNKHFSISLKEKGIVPRKTFLLEFPKCINKDLTCHFIRGSFDGDGTIGIYKYGKNFRFKVSMCGTFNFLSYISNFLISSLNIKSSVKKSKKIYVLNISSWLDAKKFLDYIYGNATIYLKRKYNKYLIFLKIIKNISNFNFNNIGENNPRVKLREKDVKVIRKLYKKHKDTGLLAKKFHVTRGTIYNMVNNITWKNV